MGLLDDFTYIAHLDWAWPGTECYQGRQRISCFRRNGSLSLGVSEGTELTHVV